MKTSRTRSSHCRSYKKVYYIVTEGKTTEPSYFKIVENHISDQAWIAICCKPADKSSLPSILEKAKSLATQMTHAKDELWVVLDQDSDSHFAHQFEKLKEWVKQSPERHLAQSIPRFEYWLLCHFENAPTRNNALSDSYIAKYLPGYDRKKDLDRHRNKLTLQTIRHAVKVASHVSADPTATTPASDVGKLVHQLIPES